MDRMVIEAQVRPQMTKGQLNELRRDDQVPAVVYGMGTDSMPLMVDGRILRQILNTGGTNVLLDLQVQTDKKKALQETVMFKDIQKDILHHERILHIDFIRISMTDKIEVNVYLNFTGEPAGVQEGGVLSLVAREVTVKCLPGDIPEQFDIDISALGIGDSITAESLKIEGDVELITLQDTTLAQVLAPMAEEEPEPVEEEIEEGEEAAAEEPTEEESADDKEAES